jgi:hypothetical protein
MHLQCLESRSYRISVSFSYLTLRQQMGGKKGFELEFGLPSANHVRKKFLSHEAGLNFERDKLKIVKYFARFINLPRQTQQTYFRGF